MTSPHTQAIIAFIGGGPRAVGLIERFNANVPLVAPGMPLRILVFDPYPTGAGRVWRYNQSPSLKMNSLAEDVAMFTDASCTMEGPVVAGPTLADWVEGVRSGEIPFTPPDSAVAAEIQSLGRQGFATRRLLSCYLRWVYETVRHTAPPEIEIQEVRGKVQRVIDRGDTQVLEYLDGCGECHAQAVDLVIYAVGHTDAQMTPAERELANRSARHGLHYWPAHYAGDADFSTIPPGERVLVRGLGLSFVDIAVRLTLDRGGTIVTDPDAPPGERVTYTPSGNEPRIYGGSRRGVPYHSKITSHFHGERAGLVTTFFTREFLADLLASGSEVDFQTEVWPTIVKETAFWHYREIFTGHPHRVRGTWDDLRGVFDAEPWGSARLDAAIRAAVAPEDIFDVVAFDRPLADRTFAALDDLQQFISAYIARDIFLREDEEHSEVLAVFWALLLCVGIVAELSGHAAWSSESRTRAIPERWFGFFSYVDSGPPAERLELILALQRAGIIVFTGGESQFSLDDERGTFIVTSPQHPETIEASYLIDGFHPARGVENSAEPVLRDLVVSGQGMELVLGDGDHPIPSGRLAVDVDRARITRPDGTQHPRRYAVGDFTSAPAAGTFARPGTNARIFRANDSIARSLLAAIASSSADQPALRS